MYTVNNYLLNINQNDELEFKARNDAEALQYAICYIAREKITLRDGFLHNYRNESRFDFTCDYSLGFLTGEEISKI